MKRLILAIAAVCFAISASAKVELPSILCDNMVLQQNANVNLWGKATPNSKITITVSWAPLRRVQTTADKDGNWVAKVDTPAATFEPQTVKISDGETLTLRNILIGDVWVCSGQSNMEMPVKGFGRQPVENSLQYILSAGKEANRIRMFSVKRARSFEEQEDCEGQWQVAAPESVANMSATAYFFAYNLAMGVDIPIGIINTSWGGTRVESWMPQAALEDILTKEQIEHKKTVHSIKPTELYCAMIAPLRQFSAKGFLWYQGCSNLGDNDHYDTMMARMVEQWRKDWGDTTNAMPFYYVMIAPYIYDGSNDTAYPLFVENQVRALSKIPNSGMAATTDIGEEKCIHPAQKFEVGQRLAALALHQTYGQLGFEAKAPQMGAYNIKDGKAVITMTNCELGLTPWYGEEVTGFEIAGADKVFHKAQATISAQSEVTVWSDEVKQPVAVRYSFRNFAPGNLKNVYGIPAVPFRTDDWNDVK